MTVAAFFGLGFAMPQLHRSQPPKPVVPLASPFDPRLRVWLDVRQFSGMSKHEVLRRLASKAGLTLDVDWRLVADRPVYIYQLTSGDNFGTVEEILGKLLHVGSVEDHAYRIDQGKLIVRDSLWSDPAVARTYDVLPILGRLRNPASAEVVGMWPDSFHSMPPPASELLSLQNEEACDNLKNLICGQIEPDLWHNRSYDITVAQGLLIVTAPAAVQARIERLIRLINGEP